MQLIQIKFISSQIKYYKCILVNKQFKFRLYARHKNIEDFKASELSIIYRLASRFLQVIIKQRHLSISVNLGQFPNGYKIDKLKPTL